MPFIKNNIINENLLFVGLSETWLKSHSEAELKIDGYTLFRCDTTRKQKRRGRLTGGSCFYVRNDIACSCEVIFKHASDCVQILCLYSSTENLALLVIYRQPDDKYNGNPSTPTDFITPLNRVKNILYEMDPAPDIIFGGDFNLPNVVWPYGTPSPKCSPDDRLMLNSLNEFCNDLCMSQHVSTPTHKDGNTLDLVFTNNSSIIHNCSTVPVLQSTSHHSIVMTSTMYKVKTQTVDDDKRPPLTMFNSLNFFSKEIDWESLNKALSEVNWEEKLKNCGPNEKLTIFCSLVFNICQDYVPVKSKADIKKASNAEKYRKTLIKRRRKLTKRLTRVRAPTRIEKINKELLQIEINLQKSFRSSESHMEGKAVDAIKVNPKYFYSYVKSKAKVKTKVGPLYDSKGRLTNKSSEMAEILSEQYVKVFSKPTDTSSTAPPPNSSRSIPPIQITKEKFIKAIDELSPSAAAGPDGYPAILLKNCKTVLSEPLVILWKASMESGIVPDILKRSIITPIHKGGSRSTAANYRPIALTSHIIKLFEKILRKHIVQYMNDHNLFNENQHGFRSGRSCLSQLLEHFDTILNIIEDNSNADVIYLDFAKAFDKVDHTIVLNKIKSLGITGQIYNWLESFLCGRFQSVIVNGITSSPQEVKSGVPQGSVLGPLIFLILIGDIDEDVIESIVKSFADDTRTTKSVNSVEDVNALQKDLQSIYEWTIRNNMELNDVKFEALRHGKNEDLKQSSSYTTPSGKVIEVKDSVKDLGVYMSSNCLFKDQINAVIEKAKNIISWILRSFTSRKHSAMMTLYKSLVIPILEYCSVLWSPKAAGLIQMLEMIQWSFIRKIIGARGMNYWECLKDMNLYSLQRRRERYRIIYVWKVLEQLVPNINNKIQAKDHIRLGRLCILNGRNASTKLDGSFTIDGPKLFNSLPKHVRDLKRVSLQKFKRALDSHLRKIPDNPLIPGYTECRRAASNSICEMAQFCCSGALSLDPELLGSDAVATDPTL